MSNNPTRKMQRKQERELSKQPLKPQAMSNDIGAQIAGPDPETAEDAFAAFTVRLFEKGNVCTVTLCDNNSQMALYQGKKEQAITFYSALKLKLSNSFHDFAVLLDKAQQDMNQSAAFESDYNGIDSFMGNITAPPTHDSKPIKSNQFPQYDGGNF